VLTSNFSEIFGSAFMKSASVFIGLVTGLIIAAATGYFNGSVISSAPAGTFLWLKTWPLHIRGQLVLPMIAAWAVIVAETIGNVTASADVSRMEISGETFMQRVQGGMLADSISATLAGLATVPPLTTFSQNSGVIALTRNASRSSGYMCAVILFLMGIIGKFGAIFVAARESSLLVSDQQMQFKTYTDSVRSFQHHRWLHHIPLRGRGGLRRPCSRLRQVDPP
jgi:xanthine/uracil permease